MTTGYVISRIGYEYNDEISVRPENDEGKPLKVYLDKEKAKAEMKALNRAEIIKCNFGEYGYELRETIRDVEMFKNILNKYNEFPEGDNDSNELYYSEWLEGNHNKLSPKDQDAIIGLSLIKFYTLTEVEFDNS